MLKLEKEKKHYYFVYVGQPTMMSGEGKPIHPITCYSNPKQAPYQPFVDYASGQAYDKYTEEYWKTLQSTIESYLDHPESKFKDGYGAGKLHLRQVKVDKIRYIGKESNDLEQTETLGVDEDTYTNCRPRSRRQIGS